MVLTGSCLSAASKPAVGCGEQAAATLLNAVKLVIVIHEIPGCHCTGQINEHELVFVGRVPPSPRPRVPLDLTNRVMIIRFTRYS